MNNQTIHAVIIEDEIPASRLLHSILKRLRPHWNIEIIAQSIAEAKEWLLSHDAPQLIFLDIQLSDGNSFELLNQIELACPIIFTTAYDQYAIQAFSVNSIDYLLKPIDENKLNTALIKFEKTLENTSGISSEYFQNIIESIQPHNKKYRTRFLISTSNAFKTLEVKDIAYFYTINKITTAVTFAKKEHIIDQPLSKLIEQLDPDQFFQANRQTIINIQSINKIEPYFNGKISVKVLPSHSEQILISKEKSSQFKRWVNF